MSRREYQKARKNRSPSGGVKAKKLLNADDTDRHGFLFFLYPRKSASSAFKKTFRSLALRSALIKKLLRNLQRDFKHRHKSLLARFGGFGGAGDQAIGNRQNRQRFDAVLRGDGV